MVFSAPITANDTRTIQMYHSYAFRIPANETIWKRTLINYQSILRHDSFLFVFLIIKVHIFLVNLTRDHQETMRNAKVPHVRICLRLITKGFTYTQKEWNTIDRTLTNRLNIDVWRSNVHVIHCNSYIVSAMCVDHYLFIPSSMANILHGSATWILLLWLYIECTFIILYI